MADTTQPDIEALPAHVAVVGDGMQVRRALPTRLRRRVGAWCFLDHYGPVTLEKDSAGMRVGPHPHMGLQTVSWLFEGSVLHRDSLGSKQLIEPGQLNLMTAGRGISHSEETPPEHPPGIHGLQFWIALPEDRRHGEPAFDHHPKLPAISRDGLSLNLIIGAALGERSPAKVYSDMAGLDVVCQDTGSRALPLDPAFEHGLFLIEGEMTLEGQAMSPGMLYYLKPGRDRVTLGNKGHARAFLLGGVPMHEDVLLWWNFVGRTTEEMQEARNQWQGHDPRFGEVRGYDGPRLVAPDITTRLRAS